MQKLQFLKPKLQQQYRLSELVIVGSFGRDKQIIDSNIDIMVDFNHHVGIKYYSIVWQIVERYLHANSALRDQSISLSIDRNQFYNQRFYVDSVTAFDDQTCRYLRLIKKSSL